MEPEQKAKITKRLRELGLWEDAQRFLDETRQRLKREGASRQEAVAQAWQAVAERYAAELAESPPELEPDSTDVLDELDELADASDDTELDLAADIQWVYRHLGDRKARPADAPSSGAWHLLQWARANKAKFFDRAMKVLMAKSAPAAESEPQRHVRQRSEEAQRRIDSLNRRIEAAEAARKGHTSA